ncbi:hypothetical protein HZH66_005015 [Vespula vulgaris]|uniref:Uncharacterized protein n=1 Tax=Vespula vulgaris TaxID=7454 RepID=A0A834K9V4_VESVU|nr:hypothetical protein HZH66_005015 [Vespula vulgaris]
MDTFQGLFLSHTTYRANEVLIQLSYSPGHSDILAFGCFGSNENIAVISGILREEVEAPTVKNFNQTRNDVSDVHSNLPDVHLDNKTRGKGSDVTGWSNKPIETGDTVAILCTRVVAASRFTEELVRGRGKRGLKGGLKEMG